MALTSSAGKITIADDPGILFVPITVLTLYTVLSFSYFNDVIMFKTIHLYLCCKLPGIFLTVDILIIVI